MFRRDRAWQGGDAAYSIDLGGERVLWLFGDSFVSPDARGSRSGAPFARNTVAIQRGYDPTTASVAFYYRREGDGGAPSSFFVANTPGTWMWPGHGARVGDALFLFLARVRSVSDGAFGFANDRSEALLVANPDDDPPRWATLVSDTNLYFPRFVRLDVARATVTP